MKSSLGDALSLDAPRESPCWPGEKNQKRGKPPNLDRAMKASAAVKVKASAQASHP
jgi:hypothetical protein